MRNWKIFLIQHAHTDIGYTERQEKLMRYHVDFIRQAMDILDDIHNGKSDAVGFKWQCENLWQLDNFFESAGDEDIERLKKYAQSGEIGLSGNYLNLNEIVDWDVLLECTMRVKKYEQLLGVRIDSGMSADINGYSWGYPDALAKAGVENLFSALHSHHGMYPLWQKNRPFYWVGPQGGKVLSWVGEHYHMGNVFGFSPRAHSDYMVHDSRAALVANGKLFTTDSETTESEEIETMCQRVERYLENLERENYPYDFVPLMVSGAATDNAPPNAQIAKRVQIANERIQNVEVKMSTLSDFFHYVRENVSDIPTYTGDFTDWWADGADSTPNAIKVYRDAQRRYHLCKKLDPKNELGRADWMEAARQNLMMYAEHTWGYSSSVSEPWDSLVALLEKKKDGYAIDANNAAAKNLDLILAKKGECSIRVGRPQQFKIINPHDHAFSGIAKPVIEFWEDMDGVYSSIYIQSHKIAARDVNTGEIFEAQPHVMSRGYELEVPIQLAPHEERILEIIPQEKGECTVECFASIGAEGVTDIVNPRIPTQTPTLLETPYFRIEIERGKGIASIIDKTTGQEMLMPGEFGAFSGFYGVTPADGLSQCEVRRRMGRNRRYITTKQALSKLVNSEIVESGSVFITMKLTYELEGCNFYYVYLKVYQCAPRLEARVCCHKTSVWDPENLYVMLPFQTDGSNETYIDKTGCMLRPGIDQLPGTCQNYWMMQQGIVRKGEKRDLIIACKDAPMISLGDLKYQPVTLSDGDSTALNRSAMASWVMNNFWETNFKADLGGFYEFTYTLESVEKTDTALEMARANELNEGILSLYY